MDGGGGDRRCFAQIREYLASSSVLSTLSFVGMFSLCFLSSAAYYCVENTAHACVDFICSGATLSC